MALSLKIPESAADFIQFTFIIFYIINHPQIRVIYVGLTFPP